MKFTPILFALAFASCIATAQEQGTTSITIEVPRTDAQPVELAPSPEPKKEEVKKKRLKKTTKKAEEAPKIEEEAPKPETEPSTQESHP
ncbi:MAG: hypothetical protein J0L97_00555 [Alphaproteobacteria bacterium]|nr:hypothetical protein [Alphaproteobacteria bacterium]